MTVHFLNAGDTAVVVQFGDIIDRKLSTRVLQLSHQIRATQLTGVTDLVPTFRSLLVNYDPLQITAAELKERLTNLLDHVETHVGETRHLVIPVCYEGEHAPDLKEVAHLTGLSTAEVINTHSNTLFHVYMLGFVPGYPYMGDLPDSLVLPRRADPRMRVPAGSVAIASTMTAIYPLESPGGWHLIGTTPVKLFDVKRESPALFRPGDTVRFEPISAEQFQAIRNDVEIDNFDVLNERIA